MARLDKGKVRLITRGGHDWASKMPQLVRELEQLKANSAWLDGEIVVLGKDGAPDFNALQKALDGRSDTGPILYFLFDLPFFDGFDLREVELGARREVLKQLLDKRPIRTAALQREFRGRSGVGPQLRLCDASGRRHRQAYRCAVCFPAHQHLAQAQVQAPPGIRRVRISSSAPTIRQ